MRTTPSELVTMSAKEIDRLTVIQRVRERRLSQKKAADDSESVSRVWGRARVMPLGEVIALALANASG